MSVQTIDNLRGRVRGGVITASDEMMATITQLR